MKVQEDELKDRIGALMEQHGKRHYRANGVTIDVKDKITVKVQTQQRLNEDGTPVIEGAVH